MRVWLCVVVVYGRVFSTPISSLKMRHTLLICPIEPASFPAQYNKQHTGSNARHWERNSFCVLGGALGTGRTDRDLHVCKTGHLESRCDDVQKGLAE